jgi:hypothetical protein
LKKEEEFYAEGSQAFFIECWFGRAGVPQIPGKYHATLDPQCADVA